MNDLRKESVTFIKVDESSEGQRIDNFLARHLKGVPKSHLYRILRSGEVRVNKGRAEASRKLVLGDEVRIPPIRVSEPAPKTATLPKGGIRLLDHVLYRDDAVIILNKPAGMAVHGGSGVSLGVIEQLRLELPECRFLELAHRLDRETSGALILACKRSALVKLHDIFRENRVNKRYLALVNGQWKAPTQHVKVALHKYLNADGERRVMVSADGKAAHTIFRLRESWPDYTLLEAELKSGRTHQIRVHLAHLGFPIAGDDKYGDFARNRELAKNGLKRMFLHAWRVEFRHPLTNEPLVIEVPLPKELQNFIDRLNHAKTV
ncbi:RNA pseudouridine synthase [Sulfuriferula sp. AH1]|uniref:RluA family pseudouridine synthase n=1 Tax=Sulfuriferula sp. AH1 TaxID=1985873 RepID=UPI000B3B748F|nr:RluA family pseudouridine synthase [Sulfuriferula sp. AH1]ARU31346.1 RNA pseudouridine synthase [Sulfuriferula sp. AH1]